MNKNERLFTRARVVRVYNHARGQRAILSRHVHPLLARFTDRHWLPVAYAQCGWLFGPHVDIVLRAHHGHPDFAEELADELRRIPLPEADFDEAGYPRSAAQLGRIEQVPPPYLPIRPHGSVEVLESPGAHWPAPLEEARDAILTRFTAAAAEERAIDALALRERIATVMVALAASTPVGLALGSMSYRSHSEAFFAASAGHGTRVHFGRRYETDRELFASIVDRQLSSGVPDIPEWLSGIDYGWGALNSLVSAGVLNADVLASLSRGQGGEPVTEFHRTFADSGLLNEPAPWFTVYRCLLNFLYSALPLLDVSPLERYYCCFAISEAIDAAFGSTWKQRLDDIRPDMDTTSSDRLGSI
ncbi:hypothetical protein [Amycolatopsis sp. lyj-108]|uniref:hypothetical protein n=1 Tax=Amycolatopsis sp. lyj-108 TaxID=2789286 RepID=UPI0039787A76